MRVEDRYCWAALQIALNLGPISLLRLFRYFPTGKAVLDASEAELNRVPGLTQQSVESVIQGRGAVNPDKIANDIQARGIDVTLLGEEAYPYNLSQIADPPAILYTKGRLPDSKMPLIAVVGSRRATSYGKTVAHKLSQELAELGWGIISGMARGVDTAAHQGALAVEGYTLAVFGCGINICYPRENNKLKRRIQEKGCILSEFPPDTPPLARNFPIRNRIISGISMGTLVVEAGERSGALITAFNALDQDRDVFAVPGPVTSEYSRGTNRLIKQGAKLVASAADISEEFPYLNCVPLSQTSSKKHVEPSLTLEQSCVLQKLTLEPIHMDQLVEMTGLSVSDVGGILTLLEFKGLAKQLPGDYFINPRAELEQKR
jgi:DNA processing protein